jgi:hypothetical protein
MPRASKRVASSNTHTCLFLLTAPRKLGAKARDGDSMSLPPWRASLIH